MSSCRHFDGADHARIYSQFRPAPPATIVDMVMEYTGASTDLRSLAVDVGCGGGQATLEFAKYFDKMLGLDVSEGMLEEARKATERRQITNVEYAVHDSSEPFELPSSSAGLVLAVTAAQWFDLPKFYANADKVLKSGGTLAIINYGITEPSPNDPNVVELMRIRKDFLDKMRCFESALGALDLNKVTEIPRAKYQDVILRGNANESSHEYYVESSSNLHHYSGFLTTLSFFQRVRREFGIATSERILGEFQDDVKKALKLPLHTPDTQVNIVIRTNFEVGLFRKPEHRL